MADRLLDLSTTEFNRPKIRIDGEDYEMRPPEEFSSRMAIRQRQIKAKRDEYGAEDDEGTFQIRKDLTDEEYEEFLMLGEENLRIVIVDMPDEVIKRLTLGQIGQIVKTWAGLFKKGTDDDKSASQTN